MSGPRRSGGSWRDRQERDPYVQQARRDGWRSRAVYKLEQIDKKERLLKPGMVVVDLGAAPGSWSQYVTEKMDTLASVEFVQGDFREDDVLDTILAMLGDEKADLVLSDMAPNISGNKAVDQPRTMYLVELALDLATRVLKGGGSFVCKVFQGEGTDAFIREARRHFERVKVVKPKASRAGSREVYLVARNYQI